MYQVSDNFVLRVPHRTYIDLIEEGSISEKDLKKIFSEDFFKESIFLASPTLYFELEKWLTGDVSSPKEIEKLKISLYKYYSRMSIRPTPYGLFAGCCLGSFDTKTDIILSNEPFHRHTRLDMNYLCALVQDLMKLPAIRKGLIYYPNSSIYLLGDKIRYVEYKYVNARRMHSIVAVENSEYLQKVLSIAKNGAGFETLANCIVDEEITLEDGIDFIDQLIDNQILTSNLEPSVTGEEFTEQIIKTLKDIPEAELTMQILQSVQNKIKKIDTVISSKNIDKYLEIAKDLEKLDTKYDLKYLYQTDKFIKTNICVLDKEIKEDLQTALKLFNRISSKIANPNLEKFKEDFLQRYEMKEVPLLQALDNESGIGYALGNGIGDISALVDDLMIPNNKDEKEKTVDFSFFQRILKSKLDYSKARLNEIEITDEDIDDLKENWRNLPHSYSSVISIIGNSHGENPNKPLISISMAGGSSAANLLGRFCYGSQDILNYAKSIAEKEQSLEKEVIFAEIVHLPESRTGNILLRPTLREYEIPYLAKPSVESEFQLTLSDLTISVKLDKIWLHSKKLNKYIIPRMANAHNFSNNSLPLYNFLCDIQHQGVLGLGFNWGGMKYLYSYLPRVRYKNIIISKAYWKFEKKDIEKIINAQSDEKLIEETKQLKKRFQLPDLLLLSDGDNKLLINLTSVLSIKAFISLVKNRKGFELEEFLYDPNSQLISDNTGVYTNEFIVSFIKNEY